MKFNQHTYGGGIRRTRQMEGFPYMMVYQAYAKTDPFTYSAKKFLDRIETKKNTGNLDDILGLKLHIAKARTELILAQFDQIRKQKEYNLKGIVYDQLKMQNVIFALKPFIYRERKLFIDIYKKKIDLYREARQEENWFLRNTMRLGVELRESLVDLEKETEKQGLLTGLEEKVEDMPMAYMPAGKYGGGLNY